MPENMTYGTSVTNQPPRKSALFFLGNDGWHMELSLDLLGDPNIGDFLSRFIGTARLYARDNGIKIKLLPKMENERII